MRPVGVAASAEEITERAEGGIEKRGDAEGWCVGRWMKEGGGGGRGTGAKLRDRDGSSSRVM